MQIFVILIKTLTERMRKQTKKIIIIICIVKLLPFRGSQF